MTRGFFTAVLVAGLGLLGGCGDDDDGNGSGGGAGSGGGGNRQAATDACHAQCDAQEKVMGCEPLVELAACKQLCGVLIADLDAECHDEFAGYYNCSAQQGFMCFGSLVSQASEPCASAK